MPTMDDAINRSVTSHPAWVQMASHLFTNHTRDPFSGNGSLDVSTALAACNVTQCLYDAALNGSAAFVNTTPPLPANSTAPPLLPAQPAHSLWLTVFLGVLAAIVSIVTVLGNLTVLLAFGLERTIRQPTNYFIASLAVSDLLIGTFSMPLFTQYLLLNYWPLGPWLCDIWLSLDWTVCLTSQYTVFFITMDRFLSVKIPAKYRNWRTERKVLVMVGITWVLPTLVFFTSIIGWQYFVGRRTVVPLTCEVQFMSDPLFTFMLTIGYYWITLFVMCVLYGAIYKVALDLQRKSDAKHRKLESTMELVAENNRRAARGGSVSDRKPRVGLFSRKSRANKKSIKGLDAVCGAAGGVAVPAGGKGAGGRGALTTSFSGRNKLAAGDVPRHDSLGGGSVATDLGDNKDDDRSSSPAFASDDEGSSSGQVVPGNKSPKGGGMGISAFSASNNNRRSTKSSLNPKAGIAGIVNTAMLTTPDSFRVAATLDVGGDLAAGLASAHHPPPPQTPPPPPPDFNSPLPRIVTTDRTPSFSDATAPPPPREAPGGTPMPPGSAECLRPSHDGGPTYSRLQAAWDSAAEAELGEEQADSLYSSAASERLEKSSAPLLSHEPPQGCPYIDEKSFLDLTSADGLAPSLPLTSASDDAVRYLPGHETESPLWKRRNSLPLPPLASDIFDIVLDDDFTDYGVTEVTEVTAMTSCLPTSSNKLNGGEDVSAYIHDDNDAPTDGECSGVPVTYNQDGNGDSDSQKLGSDSRGRALRKGDGRIHSFVKSVRSRNSRRRNRRERKSKSENRARKALRTITIILGAFVLCWTPYHIMVFVIAMCKGYGCINLGFYNFTYWLCYLNSPINPFCYAFANAQFKRTFLRILRFDWHRT